MELIITAVMLVVTYFIGSAVERRHFKTIKEREKNWLPIPATNLKHPIGDVDDCERAEMVVGNISVSMDYFKMMVATLKSIFGGNLTTFETLIDRGRREAILRMKEQAPWADEFVNLRLQSSSIGGQEQGRNKNPVQAIEVLAYATAIKYKS